MRKVHVKTPTDRLIMIQAIRWRPEHALFPRSDRYLRFYFSSLFWKCAARAHKCYFSELFRIGALG